MDQALIEELDRCWDYEEGFFGRLRQGFFEEELYQNFIGILKRITIRTEETMIPYDLVHLLWYVPLFMEWQRERVVRVMSNEEYEIKKTNVENELERIFGVPI
ncbi:hypothetical protein [Chitinophaga caseinilytica]|uniref:Uncharacterized protein n=1 Tax=Chitinophaga caseinilytica TaxID=2267521 RepID=A0ABZ2YXB7_9BACT